MPFEKSDWIWRDEQAGVDEYTDFLCFFEGFESSYWRLRIAADSNYTAYINGRLVAFGQYADYPSYKIYDEIDISGFVCPGTNRLVITAWYYGADSQTYIRSDAGLIFEVVNGEKIIAFSSVDTLSRLSRDYVSWECRNITSQLGFTYNYNMRGNDGYILKCDEGFEKSRANLKISKSLTLRPIAKLRLESRLAARVAMFGSYKEADKSLMPESMMQKAELIYERQPASALPVEISSRDGCNGVFVIVDLGSETSGFLDFDIEVERECKVFIGYGEHLIDGRCRTVVGHRNFSAVVSCVGGRNRYMNTFRRFGCRYLQIFAPVDKIKVNYLGIRPTLYPVTINKYQGDNNQRRRIYDVCVNTLRQCMHEHYEDCPWREQALYTMDSRNQMLCGYYAFSEYAFPRASLMLISKGVRDDGLLSLCYPAGLDFPIPAFSLMYFVQVAEYTERSGDVSLARELYGMLCGLMEVFISRIDETGLMLSFAGCWNFYEWSDGMSGRMKETEPGYEAPLNAFAALGMRAMARISGLLGFDADKVKYEGAADLLCVAIRERFFNSQTGLFESYENRENGKYSVLTNSVCMLCGAADNVDKDHIIRILISNGSDNCGYVTVPNTLSMNSFRFDALLAADREKYAPLILSEIDRDYGYMLSNGATSFWETIKGAADFGGAGSLCHGWSALPVYYYSVLEKNTN